MSRRGAAIRLSTLIAIAVAWVPAARAQVRVIDLIPRHFSNETFQNAEPTLAVDPANRARMAAAALMAGGDVCTRSVEAPIFATVDTGKTWGLVCKMRLDATGTVLPGDVSLRWATDGSALYAAFLWPNESPMTLRVFGTKDILDPAEFVSVNQVTNVDQPNLEVLGLEGRPRLFVAANFKWIDTLAIPGTAAILMSGGTPPRSGRSDSVIAPVETRKIAGQNPAIRLALHPSGVAYAVFYSPRPPAGDLSDVVVVRDDSAGLDRHPFTALLDTPTTVSGPRCARHDGRSGVAVASCRTVPVYPWTDPAFGGQRRVSANLSIAVDPSNAKSAWVVWADSIGTRHYLLHVRHSADGGHRWSPDLVTLTNSTNPALAVNADGVVGLLYQELQGPQGPMQRWATKLLLTHDDYATQRSFVLSTVPVATPPATALQPYIGDYEELRAVGSHFYGVFSAGNTPDSLNFPNGIRFQRLVDWKGKRLVGTDGLTVAVSIDPFFFSVGPAVDPRCATPRAPGVNPEAIGCSVKR